jgi:hypothetical protein
MNDVVTGYCAALYREIRLENKFIFRLQPDLADWNDVGRGRGRRRGRGKRGSLHSYDLIRIPPQIFYSFPGFIPRFPPSPIRKERKESRVQVLKSVGV